MREEIYNFIARFATWQVVALLFILFIICAQGFEWRRRKLGYENAALDARFWYSPADARDFLKNIGEYGRNLYAATELTLDILFPLVYGALFAALIFHVYSRQNGHNLVLIPLLAAAVDFLENFTAAYLALSFNGQESSAARAAAVFTVVKSGLFALSLIVILIGALVSIWHTPRSPG